MITHIRRAFTWNIGRIAPTTEERARLEGAGVADQAVQRYAVWRRSLLLVALLPLLAVAAIGALDALEEGLAGLAPVGVAMEVAWGAAIVALVVGCVAGVVSWTRPRSGARLLRVAWLASLLLPLLYAVLPEAVVWRVPLEHLSAPTAAEDRLEALLEVVVSLLRAAGPLLLLLPGVISVIPGAVNGCLRVKSLLPAAQLPGWLLVCAAPVFLLIWIVLLALLNQPLQSLLLVAGVVLWAGSPILYSLRGRLFVRSQFDDAALRRIAGVKRMVGLVAIAGLVLLVAAMLTAEVAGLPLLGTDPDATVTGKLEDLGDADEEHLLEGVGEALQTSKSYAYAFDLSSWRLLIDVLAKLLLATAVFADLVLSATLAAWRNDRVLRSRAEAPAYDGSAEALADSLGTE